MSTKHTPGPWTNENSGLHDVVYARDSLGADRRICELIGPQGVENGNLIAAAPDLLECCKVALWYYEAFREKTPVGPTEQDDIAAVRAVLKKVTRGAA